MELGGKQAIKKEKVEYRQQIPLPVQAFLI